MTMLGLGRPIDYSTIDEDNHGAVSAELSIRRNWGSE